MPRGQKMAIKFITNRHRPSVAGTENALSAVFASHNLWRVDCSPSRMLRGHEIPITNNRLPVIAPTGFLDRLASELKIGRHAAYRHAVQRARQIVNQTPSSSGSHSTTEAELMLQKLVEQEENCKADSFRRVLRRRSKAN